MVARRFELDVDRTAAHLELPESAVKSALTYYEAYPDEIDHLQRDNEMGEARLRRLFPNMRVIEVGTGGKPDLS
jgi:hypothetical protein